MDKKINLKVNIIFSFVSQFILYIAPLVVSPYISRVLLPEGIGSYSHAYSFAYYFYIAICFGFSSYGIKAIASNRDEIVRRSSIFWTIFIERLILGVIISFFYFVFLFTTRFGGVDLSVGIALVLIFIGSVLDIQFFFQGLEKFDFVLYANLFANILYVIFVFCFVKKTEDVLLFTIIKSSITIILNVGLWFILPKYLKHIRINKNDIFNVFLGSASFFLPSLLTSIGSQIDQSIIGIFVTDAEVGFYQQASKFPVLISNFTYAIGPVMLSRVSYLFSEGKYEEAKEKITKGIVLALFVSIPCCIGLYSIGRFFIPIFFGESFEPSINIMYCILPSSILSPISSIIINSFFYPSKKTKIAVACITIGFLTNLVITIFCVGLLKLGGIGAALGTVLGDFVLLILLFINARKVISFKFLFKDLFKIGLAGFFMAIIIFIFDCVVNLNDLLIVIFDVVIGVVAYVAFSLILKELIIRNIIEYLKQHLSCIKK